MKLPMFKKSANRKVRSLRTVEILEERNVPAGFSEIPYFQNFDSLASTATSSTLPTDWAFLETGTNANTTYTAGTGSLGTGDTYSFGAANSGERALGGLLSGSLVPTFGVSLTNTSAATLTTLTIAYTGEQWRLGATGRADRLDFQYSLDATSLTTGTWTDLDALDFVAPVTTGTAGALDGNAPANRRSVVATINSIPVPASGTLFIRWNDFDATGADDGLAVDDFLITGSVVSGPVYVNAAWSGLVAGDPVVDADLGMAGDQAGVIGTNAFATIGAAQTAVGATGTIVVNGGVYNENVTLSAEHTLVATQGIVRTTSLTGTGRLIAVGGSFNNVDLAQSFGLTAGSFIGTSALNSATASIGILSQSTGLTIANSGTSSLSIGSFGTRPTGSSLYLNGADLTTTVVAAPPLVSGILKNVVINNGTSTRFATHTGDNSTLVGMPTSHRPTH